ncbi:hypothetical protein ACFLIM_07235 [Nonomuraea sp. M3C6]|uniref:Uncharacterized protein n=1 Tax=Nonomuraea marmarensis TaxID=3351344 RepID=A0ABW7A6K4_9ACTN
MADHDRDAGSRGEEEAPRDPTSDTDVFPSDTDVFPGEAHGRLRYGEAPPGPGYPVTAHTMPLGSPPPSDSYRDFFRQKQAQIIGAGLIGLVAGALLGGTAVGVVSSLTHRDDVPRAYWEEPGWGHKRPYPYPERIVPSCRPGPDGVICVAPPTYMGPKPVPTTMVPPPPTRTG